MPINAVGEEIFIFPLLTSRLVTSKWILCIIVEQINSFVSYHGNSLSWTVERPSASAIVASVCRVFGSFEKEINSKNDEVAPLLASLPRAYYIAH